jgi:ketosteroid isomerase-like protein
MRFVLISLVLLAQGAGSIRGQQASRSDQASVALPPELARVLTDYEAGWKAGDAAALSSLFTEDGFVLSPGQMPVKGRAAIRKLYTGPGSPLSLRAFAYAMHGPVGYVIGGYSAERGMPDEGKFTLTLRKDKRGRWLIVSDMDNLNTHGASR